MGKITLYALALLALLCCAKGNDRHMICKEIADVFTDADGQTSVSNQARGPPGQKGDTGAAGPPGPRGPAGQISEAAVEDIVQRKMDTDMEALQTRIQEMEAQSTNARNTQDHCKVFYNGKCFWAILHTLEDVDFPAARRMCENSGASLAKIYGEVHQKMLADYIRTSIPTYRSWTAAWIGFNKNPTEDTLFLDNGVPANYIYWYPSFPRDISSYTKTTLNANKDPKHASQGVLNYPPDNVRFGALCEIEYGL